MSKTHSINYRPVVFKDLSSNFSFLTRSTIETKDTVKWEDGKEYPLAKVEISALSHPFYTGKKSHVSAAGRISKFKAKYAKKAK